MENIKSLITEQINLNSSQIDRKSTEEILDIINREDQTVPFEIQKQIPSITKVVDAIVDSFQKGGKLYYVGAGTSGRIGILDASECPPTYGTSPEMVQAIIAGGEKAILQSIEGAEDNEALGAMDIAKRNISKHDVVIGITASGRAPYVIGALKEAQRKGTLTVSFTCNTNATLNDYGDLHINVEVGPEVVLGSTRMKAGTAQKLVLNMITTASMIKLGKVYDNLMIDLQPLNQKLIDRAKRIIHYATGCTEDEAANLFVASGRSPKIAIVMYYCKIEKEEADNLLQQKQGFVHKAIQAYNNVKN